MSVMEEKDPRFKSLERKVGMFVILAFVFIIVAFVFIALERELFTSKSILYLIADSGTNIIEGQPVKFKGFKIGKVAKVSLNDLGKVEVHFLFQDYMVCHHGKLLSSNQSLNEFS